MAARRALVVAAGTWALLAGLGSPRESAARTWPRFSELSAGCWPKGILWP